MIVEAHPLAVLSSAVRVLRTIGTLDAGGEVLIIGSDFELYGGPLYLYAL